MNKKILFLIMASMFSLLSCFDLLDTYENNAAYKLGDRGPAGGWIFYINPNWKTDGWRYLEAAPEDQCTVQVWWSPINITPNPATKDGFGKGYGDINTTTIIAAAGNSGTYAAKLCADFEINGYNDWYLPTASEVQQMYLKLYSNSIGNFVYQFYWYSDNGTGNSAYNYNFGNNSPNFSWQSDLAARVRAVRYF